MGGEYAPDNLVAKDAAECMRIRGPVAQRVMLCLMALTSACYRYRYGYGLRLTRRRAA